MLLTGSKTPMAGSIMPLTGSNMPLAGSNTLIARNNIPLAGSVMPLAGNNTSLAGSNMLLTGSNMPLAGSNMPLAGSVTPLAGNNTSLAGNSTPLAGSNTLMAGNNTSLARSNMLLAGSNTPLAGSNTLMAGNNTLAGSNTSSRSRFKPKVHSAVGSLLQMLRCRHDVDSSLGHGLEDERRDLNDVGRDTSDVSCSSSSAVTSPKRQRSRRRRATMNHHSSTDDDPSFVGDEARRDEHARLNELVNSSGAVDVPRPADERPRLDADNLPALTSMPRQDDIILFYLPPDEGAFCTSADGISRSSAVVGRVLTVADGVITLVTADDATPAGGGGAVLRVPWPSMLQPRLVYP
ncbi:uncharacterized protein LOC108669990 [Hyalella azteca]|uniref:Uncharacterized protein LOC108669990 n=1 Tax=Hyalella azteca TaxID=294128 RepID=A0A8B7NH16_HYAAZ|nr:uncharacterized protein LOC108669990 [Hyalella azteca]